MLLPVGLGTVISRLMSDVEIACAAEHEDNLGCSYRVIILLCGMLGQ